MLKLAFLSLVIGFTAAPGALALDRKILADVNQWAKKQAEELLDQCGKKSIQSWVSDYQKSDKKLIEAMDELGDPFLNRIPKDAFFNTYLKGAFPYHLMESYPLRGAYLGCLSEIQDLKQANTKQKRIAAKSEWVKCLKANDPGEMENRVLRCLNQLK